MRFFQLFSLFKKRRSLANTSIANIMIPILERLLGEDFLEKQLAMYSHAKLIVHRLITIATVVLVTVSLLLLVIVVILIKTSFA